MTGSTTSDKLEGTEFDLQLTSGRIRARRVGSLNAPLVLFVHGLSAHLHAFDFIIEKLADQHLQLVAVDLRGRGHSEITPAGSYGLDAHCSDVLEIATLLGADQFDLVGWSMGALIGICVADRAPKRLRQLVLIDHAGKMDQEPVDKITKGLNRLDMVVAQPSDYVEAMRVASAIAPWTPFWARYFDVEQGPYEGAFKATTSKSACSEDLADIIQRDMHSLWKNLTMPVLLLRCTIPIGGGFIVPALVCDALHKAMPHIQIAEIDADHYRVMDSEIASALIKRFLGDGGTVQSTLN